MENQIFNKMLEANGGKRVIPTILIDGEVFTSFDRNRLKEALGVK
ncbi:hypothetical protein NC797_03915 [Aquibacillus sp. 3ASR75-11]|uniref:Glutaredoxin n=1 Tax=Terrihalobacillus insolitus TaxID=2950438 RepID=A0A9X4AMM5_9BACI|nr:hypothetical protein [Terrihalobacillus insolitus]MDC3423653.1 hypothetical protein [Terrihalobacillus insolitus]